MGRGRRGQRRRALHRRLRGAAATRSPSSSGRRSRTSTRATSCKGSRARIVEAADTARRQLERNLHDGAQQRLVGLAIQLRLADQQLGPEATPGIEACIQELLGALEELRDLARGLHPAVFSERGLAPALEALARARRSRRPLTPASRRLPEAQEVALYFVAAEALANVAKYAQATQVEIRVQRQGQRHDRDRRRRRRRGERGRRQRPARPRGSGRGARRAAARESPPGVGTTVRAASRRAETAAESRRPAC